MRDERCVRCLERDGIVDESDSGFGKYHASNDTFFILSANPGNLSVIHGARSMELESLERLCKCHQI